MARQAVTLAGAFVGAAVGAPQLGFFLGSLVGNAIDPVRIKAPSIGDISQQTSAEGVACPLYAGTAGGAGNLIYASEPDIVDGGTSSGKGGPEVENPDRAYVTFIIRIGASLFDGPGYRQGITGLIKVWEDEKLVYDVSSTSTILEESAKYAEGFTFYPGTQTQLPDPDVEAIEGVGNVPSYRGRAIFVKKRHDVTDRRGSIPNYRFEVSVNAGAVSAVVLATNEQFYDGSPADLAAAGDMGLDPSNNLVRVSPDGSYAAGGINGSTGLGRFELRKFDRATASWVSIDPPAQFPAGWPNALAWSPDGRYLAISTSEPGEYLWVYKRSGDTFTKLSDPSSPPPNGTSRYALAWNEDGTRLAVCNASSLDSLYVYDFVAETLASPRVLASPGTNEIGGSAYRLDWNGDLLACQNGQYVFVVDTAQDPMPVVSSVLYNSESNVGAGCYWNNARDHITVVDHTKVYVFSWDSLSNSLTLVGEYPVLSASSVESAIDFSRRYIVSAGALGDMDVIYLGEGDVPVPSLFETISDAGVFTVSFVGDQPQQQIEPGYTTFEQVTLATGRRVKLPDSIWNLPGLDAKVIRGTVVASQGYTAQDFLNSLRLVFPCDGACFDGKIHILLRGGAVDAELDDEFMVEDDSDLEQEEVLRNGDEKRQANLRRPARINVMFPNANVGYALTKAVPPNFGDRGDAVGETSVQVPVILDEETEAPQLADVLDKIGRADAEGEIVRVWPEYLAAELVPGSIVRLTSGDLVRRTRVENIRRGDGTVRTLLRIDRTHAYGSLATAQPTPGWPTPPPSLPGETTFAVLNSPGIIDSDDAIGVRIAVSGAPDMAWRGARIDYRVAGDSTWITLGTYTQRAVIGSLRSALPTFSPYFTDYWHTLQVELLQDDDLEALTREQLLREGNPAAIVFPSGEVELLQFQTPTEVGTKQWDAVTLLRGRLGTTAGPHLAGARFVMLAGTVFAPLPSSLIGKNLQFRVTSLGNSPETAPIYDFTWSPAHCQREFAPVRLELERSGGTISGTWTARKRFGTDVAPIHSANFTGYRVTLTDGVTTTVLPDTTDTSFSTSDAAFTGDITVTVQGLNRITGAGPGISETI